MQLDAYRGEAEAFVGAIGLEHYLHFAGLKHSLDIEPIYERHAGLFTRAALEDLRALGNRALLEFCVEGLVGRAIAAETAALAQREAELELSVNGSRLPFRAAPIEQGRERDPDRREAIESARLEATEAQLNELHVQALERAQEVVTDLGWQSVTAMCSDLSGIDLPELARRAERLLADTDARYDAAVVPAVRAEAGVQRLRRSDLPAFFRAPSLDAHFPAGPLLAILERTLVELDVEAWERVTLDADARPTKSPRAFCAAVQVPDEIYLVIAPHGGRDDYETILHEAGHAQHYAHVDRRATVEQRHLGDNSVTEAYAFLFQRLATEPEWLRRQLAIEEPGPVVEHARAAKLVLVRRYAAKLGYEVELHEGGADAGRLRSTYARRLSAALRLDWPEATWLADVDPFFYAARYLRAWALEAELSRELRREHGPEWFAEPAAGARMRDLWAAGQPTTASELLGREPDLSVLAEELASPASA